MNLISLRHSHVLACLVASLLTTRLLFATDYFVTIGGGYNPSGNQASLEANIIFFQTFEGEASRRACSRPVLCRWRGSDCGRTDPQPSRFIEIAGNGTDCVSAPASDMPFSKTSKSRMMRRRSQSSFVWGFSLSNTICRQLVVAPILTTTKNSAATFGEPLSDAVARANRFRAVTLIGTAPFRSRRRTPMLLSPATRSIFRCVLLMLSCEPTVVWQATLQTRRQLGQKPKRPRTKAARLPQKVWFLSPSYLQ